MVKEPRPGRVKTRLGAGIGMTSAAWWYRHQALGLVRRLRDPRWSLVLAVSPDREGMQSRVWPSDIARIAQDAGDLGNRMRHCLMATPGPTVLIGSDIPGVTRAHIAKAFQALGPARSVLGPATDGGFWLVGLKSPARAPRTLFKGVRWSQSNTMAETRSILPAPVAVVAMLSDIDTATDLKAP
ncbi:MAG: glycosyltransferase [Silicimonas sp.]|nr:glycosyltransferase [Silicimonas sp.]